MVSDVGDLVVVGLRRVVVLHGRADATAREWAVLNKEIGNDVELITDPNYFIACRL